MVRRGAVTRGVGFLVIFFEGKKCQALYLSLEEEDLWDRTYKM
jgi:hypothetical protein